MASSQDYHFGALDYVIVAMSLALTAAVGIRHVLCRKQRRDARSFLVADRKLGLVPLALSAVATSLTSGNLLITPMQGYGNGAQMSLGYVGFFLGLAATASATMPILFRLQLGTVNQYVEYRFNRFLRIFPAFVNLVQSSFSVAAIIYVTALVFSQGTGLDVASSTLLLGGLCIVYSALGGFAAVIWTDVFQVIVIFATFALLAVEGTAKAGGISAIWEKNRLGLRTTWAHWSPVPYSNYTVWSLVIGEFAISFCAAAGSQAHFQRQMANEDISGARKTIFANAIVTQALSLVAVWIGMAAFARYYLCDPVLAGQIDSIDQIVSHFAMDVFRSVPGFSGLFVSGILCATLSTLSSYINSVTAIVLIDFIRPLVPNMSDRKMTWASKVIGLGYGAAVMGLSFFVKYFGTLLPVLHAIGGAGLGIASGVYILGMLVPWATSKGACIGYFASLFLGWWLAIGRILTGNEYVTAPLSTDGCTNHTAAMTTLVAPPSGDRFALYDIAPVWFASITLSTCIVVGTLVSVLTGATDLAKLDPALISPLTKSALRQLLPRRFRKPQSALGHFLQADAELKASDKAERNDMPMTKIAPEDPE